MISDLSDLEVLALTIYGEARGEPIEGQVAVGCVIRNRVRSGEYINYKAACLAPLQFSCWNPTDPNYSVLKDFSDKLLMGQPTNDLSLSQCHWVAIGIIASSIKDNTGSARNYLTTQLYRENTVEWAKKLTLTKVIGRQSFLA